jgi:hypothetical protein
LHTEEVGCTLPVGREIKMEIPGNVFGRKVVSTHQISEPPLRNP